MENSNHGEIPDNKFFTPGPDTAQKLYDHTTIGDFRRYVLLKTSLVIIALIGCGYSMINISRGVMGLAIIEISLIPICLALVWMLRYARYFNFVKKAFTIIVFIFGLAASGIANTFPTIFVWNALVPVLAFFLWEKKMGTIISAVFLPIATVLFLRVHASGPDSLPLPALSNIVVFIIMISFLTYFYEATRADTEDALKKDIAVRKEAEKEKEKLIIKLQKALAEVETLSGLLPICASCKKIRDDKGYWNQIESFLQEHSKAKFSHGICPDCAASLYGDEKWFKDKKQG